MDNESTIRQAADPFVFLSYARPDQEAVEKVYDSLLQHGFRPWMDVRDIPVGAQWKLAIRDAMETANFIVVFFSSSSVARRGYFQREIREALDAWQEMLPGDVYLIPARLEPCDVPRELGDFNYADLFSPEGLAHLLDSLIRESERRGLKDSSVPLEEAIELLFRIASEFHYPPMAFYDVMAKRKFVTTEYELRRKSSRSKKTGREISRFFLVAKSESGDYECWKVSSQGYALDMLMTTQSGFTKLNETLQRWKSAEPSSI